MMVTITPDDYDYEAMNKIFRYDDAEDQDGDRALANVAFDDASTVRELRSTCSSLRIIEVAIDYASSFCTQFGGASRAQSRVEAIVALASQRFEVPGLCTTLQISNIDGYCNPSTDIYMNIGGNADPLDSFRNFWNANRTDRHRDTAHLFTGTDYSADRQIGVAYLPAVCMLEYAYGINWITL
jgi:hypothetical protein